ncbi:MAG: glutamine-hydrolyzing GMP synthase [Pseudomonadota bacterium]
MNDIHEERVLILDFGAQYTQLIARRIREAGVYSEILPWDLSPERIASFGAKAIILSGGPESVNLENPPRVADIVFTLGVPVLGICYGMQAMAAQLGGGVSASSHREFGFAEVDTRSSVLFGDLDDSGSPKDGFVGRLQVWMSHGDKVDALPDGFVAIGQSANSPLAAMEDPSRQFFAVQFHPEVTHTLSGAKILTRFVREIAGCTGQWTTPNIARDAVDRVREMVGSDRVLLGLSGGVDSSVVAALLHEAIGDQLSCVFVDHGLLREHEGDQVMATFADNLGVKVTCVDASDRFFSALKGVSDPEQKRKIIGREFVEVFEAESNRETDVVWLAQGTIYPDVIESAGAETGKAHVIKSHHNVGGLPAHMKLKLLEPLRELFKDEVRELGVELGLPHKMVYRHPFPGPGLGVRILGEVERAYADKLRKADQIFIEELRAADLYDKTSQAFAVFLPVKSVAVMGDGRAYDHVIALRAVETVDFMTARWARLPYEFLERVSLRICNEVAGVSRVTYDISGKPPATIEWE